jgi:penicillin-binding protein 1B
VVVFLTLATLPLVAGAAFLIYEYMRASVIVERRLKSERWMVPSRLYTRPLALRPGLVLGPETLVRILNGLKYEQKSDVPPAPGEFVVREGVIVLTPRPNPDAAGEPVAVVFEKGRLKEMRGVQTKKPYPRQVLEPALITYLFDESREKRRFVSYQELPDHLIKAVLAIEDRRFFSHPGLDPFRIVGAAIRNIRAESFIQGGSTITQQLVKNFFLTPERTFKRKAQEALLAFVLERRADKEHPELYLNEIYLGQIGSFSINGVGEAARVCSTRTWGTSPWWSRRCSRG